MPAVSIHQFVIVCFFIAVSWAAIGDLREFKIPNRLVLLVLGFYPAHLMASPLPVDWVGGAVTGAVVFFAGFYLFSRGLIGGGDVKLLAAVGLWAGPTMIAPTIFLVLLAGGVLSIVFLVHERLRAAGEASLQRALALPLPYGIAIAVGTSYLAGRLVTTG